MIYLLLKSIHITCVIVWITGLTIQSLLLFVSKKLPGPMLPTELARLRKIHLWEKRITSPAMLLTFVCGITMTIMGGWHTSLWVSVKFCLAILLAYIHGHQSVYIRKNIELTHNCTNNRKKVGLLPLIISALIINVCMAVFKP
ncbi:CopD family protein [Vibrio vulnificus]|nr:CopD family protein [Vibrio vulnificus]